MALHIERPVLILCCLAYFSSGLYASSTLRIVNEWAEMKFNFPSPKDEQIARQKGFYVPGSSLPIDVDAQYTKTGTPRKFVTIPRFSSGIPITFGTVDPYGRITAYPNYTWHDNQGQNCDGITSVIRVAIDRCNRMWVMDTGKIGDSNKCPPKLMAFDLNNDQLIYKYDVDSSSYSEMSSFATPVVDVRGDNPNDCSNTFVYVADPIGFGILVVDVQNRRSWRVTDRAFYVCAKHGRIEIQGIWSDMFDGVLGMALTPYKSKDQDRYLFFHSLADVTENVVSTSILRNESHMQVSRLDKNDVYTFPHERPSQSVAEAMDSNGILYFGLIDPPSIWCWNSATNFTKKNFHLLALNTETLHFASGLKVIADLNGHEHLWVLTSSYEKSNAGVLSTDDINFRIHTEKISTLIAKSPCRRSSNAG